ncbi:N-acetylmuramoyl-L-alanine amidase [Nonomuraea sp. NN258]|uniref:N-acetylmuramoyl-L-alanine amidase n=1 Tax=Nonomuraea antri TaxID=2730852 RepID=UPI00156A5A5B|nr:peptidoglycan recognition family protein [Nonomuraea antri]NRQ31722.1 N-acetylmuramoyl-L-alanine amidase [Nonomuraea antri]
MLLWLAAAALTAGSVVVSSAAAVQPAPGQAALGSPAPVQFAPVHSAPGRGRQADFAAAAREFGVPENVLLAVSYLESRWDANGGRPSTSGGFGPMHLVDVAAAEAAAERAPGLGGAHGPHPHGIGDAAGDARGDDSRPLPPAPEEPPPAGPPAAALRSGAPTGLGTLVRAAELTGERPGLVRRDPAANIRAGAALLASYQRRPSTDPADWYDAVADYSGSGDPLAGRTFADEVYSVMRTGAVRRTDDGHLVRLSPTPTLTEPKLAPAPAAAPAPGQTAAECPRTLACEWMPAAHKRHGKKKSGEYGNHDRVNGARTVNYIVIHDTEGTYQGIPSMINDPKYVSWHYTIRSRDGHVAQHVATKDIGWHAGNWDVNVRSIGIEHEGYLAKGGTWYTEAMYRSSAKLVRYLAGKYRVPIDRAHILGHDNVPGTTPQTLASMHEDPGPYWDWAHYFELMGHLIKGAKNGTSSVLIRPDYDAHRPRFTGCTSTKPGRACPTHGAASVWLHTQPSPTAPLVNDEGKHPGKPATYSVYDHSARASTGQRYAVAGRQGDWTAIWYLGQKAWFHNPDSRPTAVSAKGPLVTPLKPGTKVYGRAYPEKGAYQGVTFQRHVPLKYTIGPGQSYTLGGTYTGAYYAAGSLNPAKHVMVRGGLRYHQIQLGHRVMFVKANDVRVIR